MNNNVVTFPWKRMQLPVRIGIFDSGAGGLSILNALLQLYPFEFVFFADTAHLPYGQKSPDYLLERGKVIARFFLSHNITTVIVACHTFSATVLHLIRELFPTITFIDMLPPTIHAAAYVTRNKKIAVLATSATIESHIHKRLCAQWYPDFLMSEQACPLLVPLIEADNVDETELKKTVQLYVDFLKIGQQDTCILGCTHYAFIASLVQECVPAVQVISAHLLMEVLFYGPPYTNDNEQGSRFFITGSLPLFERSLISKMNNVHNKPYTLSLYTE